MPNEMFSTCGLSQDARDIVSPALYQEMYNSIISKRKISSGGSKINTVYNSVSCIYCDCVAYEHFMRLLAAYVEHSNCYI